MLQLSRKQGLTIVGTKIILIFLRVSQIPVLSIVSFVFNLSKPLLFLQV